MVYIEDLFRESFDREGSRGAFLERFLDVHGIHNGHLRGQLAEYLLSLDARAMADKIMAGVRKSDIGERGLSLIHILHMWFLISGLGILLILVILIGIGGLLKKKRSPLT